MKKINANKQKLKSTEQLLEELRAKRLKNNNEKSCGLPGINKVLVNHNQAVLSIF